MASPALQEQVVNKLNELSDEQLAELLRYIGIIESNVLPDDYNEDKDPTDLSARTKAILRQEITSHSGWTQKKDGSMLAIADTSYLPVEKVRYPS
jgi:hypothetical protein